MTDQPPDDIEIGAALTRFLVEALAGQDIRGWALDDFSGLALTLIRRLRSDIARGGMEMAIGESMARDAARARIASVRRLQSDPTGEVTAIRVSACAADAGLDALRSMEDPDEVPRCVDCGVEVDGLGPPICSECAEDG